MHVARFHQRPQPCLVDVSLPNQARALEPDLDARAGRAGSAAWGWTDVVRVEDGAFSTTDLSQGQRQRLALLAACSEDRPVCVLDEWAAQPGPRLQEGLLPASSCPS